MENTDLIKWKQQIQFEGEHSDLKFDNPNFYDLAKSFNMWGKQIESAEEFIPALKRSIQTKRTSNNWSSS